MRVTVTVQPFANHAFKARQDLFKACARLGVRCDVETTEPQCPERVDKTYPRAEDSEGRCWEGKDGIEQLTEHLRSQS